MNEIVEILETIKPGIDYLNQNNLISNDILSSFDIISLVPILNEKFQVNITVVDLIPENFETVKNIFDLINRLK